MENVDIVISLVQTENGIGVSTVIPVHLTAVQVIMVLDQVKNTIQQQVYSKLPEVQMITIDHLQKADMILVQKNKIIH